MEPKACNSAVGWHWNTHTHNAQVMAKWCEIQHCITLTDGAGYMKKVAEVLIVSFPKMIHVTCVVHALHRLCECIRLVCR